MTKDEGRDRERKIWRKGGKEGDSGDSKGNRRNGVYRRKRERRKERTVNGGWRERGRYGGEEKREVVKEEVLDGVKESKEKGRIKEGTMNTRE